MVSRNKSAFQLYFDANRARFQRDQPKLTDPKVLRRFVKAWYSEEEPIEEKLVWLLMAEADKARYLAEQVTSRKDGHNTNSGKKKAKKSEKEKDEPKGKRNSYCFFKDSLKTDQVGCGTEVKKLSLPEKSKHASTLWKKMTLEERRPYEVMAEEDKNRYHREKASKVLIEKEMDKEEDYVVVSVPGEPNNNTSKAEANQNARKRPRNAYNFFWMDQFPQIKSEQPKLNQKEIGAIIGKRWKNMKDSDRKIYVDKAIADNIRYREEL